jgi:hypothetical protein
VRSRDGQDIGTVAHVLAVEDKDIFEGFVVSTRPGPGGYRFADAEEVGSIHQRGVTLTRDAEECRSLPEPTANPAVLRDDPAWGSTASERLQDRLRRAWDLVSGNY